MFSEEKLSQAGQKKPTKYWYKIFLLKYIVRFATWKNCISKLSIKIFIKKPKAVKAYSYRMTSVTHKIFFNFTPDNCVCCEAALSDITPFFADIVWSSVLRWTLFQFTTIVKLSESFTLPIGKITLKQKQNERFCTSSGGGVNLIENERMR